MRFPLLARVVAVSTVTVLILASIGLISRKISEREARAQSVVSQFSSETSGPQLFVGPLLALTCEETFTEERQAMRSGKVETVSEKKLTTCPTAYFSPRSFKASASVPVNKLHRGIFSIRTYNARLTLSGEFDWPDPPAPNGSNPRAWKEVYVVSYIRDPRGIKTLESSFKPSKEAEPAEPSLAQFPIKNYLGSYTNRNAGVTTPFEYKMSFIGTSSLQIAPIGEQSDIQINSNWRHPSFLPAWSPDHRDISSDGFKAAWQLSSLATGGRPVWNKAAGDRKLDSVSGVGVSLFDPVNVYALSHRATEYAFLFVLFTFTTLALTEVLFGVRLHPIQYALVGSAIAVFFLLLLAFSEHIAFDLAYLIASSACVLLLTFYLRHPLETWKRTGLFFAIFVGIYAALYYLLVSEDNSLLMGSLLVFFTLATTMIATRKLDWAKLSGELIAVPKTESHP